MWQDSEETETETDLGETTLYTTAFDDTYFCSNSQSFEDSSISTLCSTFGTIMINDEVDLTKLEDVDSNKNFIPTSAKPTVESSMKIPEMSEWEPFKPIKTLCFSNAITNTKERPHSEDLTMMDSSKIFDIGHAAMTENTSFDMSFVNQLSSQSNKLTHTQADLEKIIKIHEDRIEEERCQLLKEQEQMKEKLGQLSQVAREYEKIFDDLLNNKDKCLDSKEKQMEAEREQAWEHLSANEQSYAEVCKRNNKLKLIISGSRLSEAELKKTFTKLMEEAKSQIETYSALKVPTAERLTKVNNELNQIKANSHKEISTSQAQLKLIELKCNSLQSQISDCDKENDELTKLCDDLLVTAEEPKF